MQLCKGCQQIYRYHALQEGNISGANQPLRTNYRNFNLDHQINIQGGGAQRGGRGDLQKSDYPIQGRVQIVKLPNAHTTWMLIQWLRLEFS